MDSLFAPLSTPDLNCIPFAGAEFNATRDTDRLLRQVDCIRDVALSGEWWTIQKLTAACRKRFPSVRFPENSVQAQLRNLRKVGYVVERRNVAQSGCLFEYRVWRLPVLDADLESTARNTGRRCRGRKFKAPAEWKGRR